MFLQNLAHRRRLLFVTILLCSLALGALVTPEAQARIIICKADPVVHLSDHTKIHLIAAISLKQKKVDSIQWTLHVPPDLQVDKIQYNNGTLGEKETVHVLTDGNPGEFAIELLVLTQKDPVQVVSKAKVNRTGNKTVGSAVGESGQALNLVVPQP